MNIYFVTNNYKKHYLYYTIMYFTGNKSPSCKKKKKKDMYACAISGSDVMFIVAGLVPRPIFL